LALCHGGSVSRIAQDVIDFDRNQLVPDASIIRPDGRSVKVEDATLWYDALSEAEIQLICGVYHVYTGTNKFSRVVTSLIIVYSTIRQRDDIGADWALVLVATPQCIRKVRSRYRVLVSRLRTLVPKAALEETMPNI
jgi:hypothetical protein